MSTIIQDEVHLSLSEDITVVHETVKVSVNVVAQIDPKTTTEEAFRAEVRAKLNEFIDAEWKITGIQRQSSGKYEQVFVTATARVEEKENVRLEERAEAVSRIGLELRNPEADTTLPTKIADETNESLRVKLAEKAVAEAKRYSDLLGATFRVSHLTYQRGGSNIQTQKGYARAVSASLESAPMMASAMPSMYQDASSPAGGSESEETEFNVSTKFTMSATVVLRAIVATA